MNLGSRKMIGEIKGRYGLNSPDVLQVMADVPREEFVPPKFRNSAYDDCPIPIGFGQTISQPYTVAFMTDLLLKCSTSHEALRGKVLEIGTGSGYQAAILAKLFKEVYTIERIRPLFEKARKTLKRLGYKNIYFKLGQGEVGWPEKAPFAGIMLTAGVKKVPQELFRQLKPGGVLVAPVGKKDKVMTRYFKLKTHKITKTDHGIFHFVPLIHDIITK